MRVNFNRYLAEMERLGYSNNFEILDAMGLWFTASREKEFLRFCTGKEKFIFDRFNKNAHAGYK